MSAWLCILLFIVLPHVLLAIKVFGPGINRSATYVAYRQPTRRF